MTIVQKNAFEFDGELYPTQEAAEQAERSAHWWRLCRSGFYAGFVVGIWAGITIVMVFP